MYFRVLRFRTTHFIPNENNLKNYVLLVGLCSGFLLSALYVCKSLYISLYPLSLSLTLTPTHPPSLFPDKKFPIQAHGILNLRKGKSVFIF